ncbi:hypothetical protein [Thermotoga sp.]|nr:hypothetical protein [Thermotoga sp.]
MLYRMERKGFIKPVKFPGSGKKLYIKEDILKLLRRYQKVDRGDGIEDV